MQKQLELPLLGRIDCASIVPPSMLTTVRTYRQAVRLCWTLRRVKGMNTTDFARQFHFNRQHIGDYLNPDDGRKRRNLPPGRIADFEDGCGNAAITQWLASRQKLTVIEELQAERAAMEKAA